MTTKQIENVEKLVAWSLIDSRPVLLYCEEYDETLVAWNGILMNETIAINVAIEEFNKYPTPKMKRNIYNVYKQLYYTGFFGEQNWDSFFKGSPDNLFSYLRRINSVHLRKVIKDKKITEVLGWFST